MGRDAVVEETPRDVGSKQDNDVSTTAGAASRPSRRRSNPEGRGATRNFVRSSWLSGSPGPFIKSRCQDRIREYFTRAQSRVPTCTAQNVPQSVARAMQHARNLHANACCGSKTRCKPHGSRGRVPNLSHGGNATPSRATRCLVQQLRVATSCMARAPRVAARWKCCNKTARVRRRYN